jgi:tetratricopeptide (TPR) repeat protein
MHFGARNIYLNYFQLGETAYRDKVRFYEENPEAISLLYFDEKLDIDIDYMLCLFEVGRYERFISKVDKMLETIIIENIFEYKNENIFNELLFRKAACQFHLCQYNKSKDILKQLIHIDKNNPLYIGLYAICNRKLHNDSYITSQAVSMAALLLVVGITIARIFLIEPFFDLYLEPFLILRMILLCVAVSIIIGLEAGFQYRIFRETGMFTYSLLNKIYCNKKRYFAKIKPK